MSSRSSIRRPSSLIVYWRGDQFVVENYMTNKRRRAGADVIELLNQFGRWRRPDSVLKHLVGRRRSEMRRLIRQLTADSFLEVRHQRGSIEDRGLETWQSWHPAASFFHFATKDPPFATTARGEASVEADLLARASTRPMPAKRYRGLSSVRLPAPTTVGEFPRTLLARRTWRRFGAGPLDVQSLSKLLALSFGVHWKLNVRLVGPVFFTTSPSGGGRHPLETYVVVQNVTGLAPGIYHYQNDRHRLTRIGKRMTRPQLRAFFPGQSWCAAAPVVVLMTAVFARTEWKYPHPRAYRVLLTEAGHVCQTFCLTATWLDLAPFCTMALADSVVDHHLGLDGKIESVIYAAG